VYTPWKQRWRISTPQPPDRPVQDLALSDCRAETWRTVVPAVWPTVPGLVDVHALAGGQAGTIWAQGEIEVPAAMSVELLLGTDHPCRIWIGKQLAATVPTAHHPVLKDGYTFPVTLPAGQRTITIALDWRGGQGRGFFLRFRRPGAPTPPTRLDALQVELPLVEPEPIAR
jgi:hypothetical protein